MARHHETSAATNMPVFFCQPRSPWQRGTNENTNGLLRGYFPKGTDLSIYTPEDLERAAEELNNRLRKDSARRHRPNRSITLKMLTV
jgi:transposase, IS30 family